MMLVCTDTPHRKAQSESRLPSYRCELFLNNLIKLIW